MRADAALRREVPHAGVSGRASLGRVGRIEIAYCGILVVSPHYAASSLYPGHKLSTVREIPAHLDGRDADAGEGPADGIGRAALFQGKDRTDRSAADPLELRRVGLPQRKDLDRILEVATEMPCPELRCEHLAKVTADQEEAEVGSLLQADSALYKRAVLPWS